MTSKVSIAVCTYNPNPRLLNRLLTAIEGILKTSPWAEVLLVDNNSSPAVSTLPAVQNVLGRFTQVRCVVEPRQGLAAARCRAIRETSAPVVVFFDDDNEPDLNYLLVLDRYFTEYPYVGIWGPGELTVEYVDRVEPWLYQHSESFQLRHLGFGYTCVPATWGPYYPTGTGFAVRRDILERYAAAIEQGSLQTTDRKGKSLASAGDVQIVWEGIKMGFAVGMIPELRCNHLITADKANLNYLKRLNFGTESSYGPALLESFPSQIGQLHSPPSMVRVYKQLAISLIKMALRPQQRFDIQLQFAARLGRWYGHARALQSPDAHKFLSMAERFKLVTKAELSNGQADH